MNLWGIQGTEAGIWKEHWCWCICWEAPLLTLTCRLLSEELLHSCSCYGTHWTPGAFQNLLRSTHMGLKVCVKHLTPLAHDFTDVLFLCIQISKNWISGSPKYAVLVLFKYFHRGILIWSTNGEKKYFLSEEYSFNTYSYFTCRQEILQINYFCL